MVLIQKQVDDKAEAEIQKLEDHFQELKEKISVLRRNGIDTSMPELLISEFAPRVKMARVAYEKDDIHRIKKLLTDLENETALAEKGSDFSSFMQMLYSANDLIRDNKIAKAEELYSKLSNTYKLLPKDLQRLVYAACADMRQRLDKATHRKTAK